MDNEDTIKYLKKMKIEEDSEEKSPIKSLVDKITRQDHMEEDTRIGRIASDIDSLLSSKRKDSNICPDRLSQKSESNQLPANGSPKTVAVTAADNSIQETYLMCEKVKLINPNKTEKTANTSSNVGWKCSGHLGILLIQYSNVYGIW
ncbi:hypothetical protein DINM_003987 [Dirofilaria immitis]|nr:hypothetical protein [Dirofilaria immitis]